MSGVGYQCQSSIYVLYVAISETGASSNVRHSFVRSHTEERN